MVRTRERKTASEAVFLWSLTEFGGDGERSSLRRGEKKEEDNGGQWEFHGARPLGASGPSRVSGPRQSGQLSRARGSVVFTSWLLGLLVEAKSRCLAF